jgi:hypothetical protein
MGVAEGPMPVGSLQRLLVEARKQLNLPQATPHTLRQNAESREMPSEPD